ncbi:MAG: T9SS C-terminal target domain-containing protein [Chitinophagaceae bacterium]|nr:MAG: T9SS C-terminal target domain-containing protein [Chitinophagaceae bacterium]
MNLVLKFCTTFLIFIIFFETVSGQIQRCHSTEYKNYQIENVEGYAERLAEANDILHAYKHSSAFQRQSNDILTIPVVVHVVYNTAVQNISDEQILSQIEVLNEDFRRLNADAANTPAEFQGVAADAGIEFCLATTDPDGNETTGITRTQTSINQFFFNNNVKYTSQGGKNGWDPTRYLNIWVCNLGGGLLGYAEMPTANPGPTDGVVIGYTYFGRTGTLSNTFNKGRTTTHEVGHWLGLLHNWGDGGCGVDDNIADTPLQGQPYYGCPAYPQSSCGSSDMFMNYMDYVDDACMNTFTEGQRTRMRAVLNTLRSSILSSDGCTFQVEFDIDAAIEEIKVPGEGQQICASRFYPEFILRNNGGIELNTATIEYELNGNVLFTYDWTGSLTTFQSEKIRLPIQNFNTGNYTLTIRVKDPNGFQDQNPANDSLTVNFTVTPAAHAVTIPLKEGFEDPTFPPAGWQFSNPGATFQWTRTTNAGGFGLSLNSAFFDSFNGSSNSNPDGKVKSLLTPTLSLQSTNFPFLEFDIAYARFDESFYESFEVAYSIDCGTSWNVIYQKSGLDLATATDKSIEFYPTDTEWRREHISINHINGIDYVDFRFTIESGWGNNLFLDNINISQTPSSVGESELPQRFKIYPNPVSNQLTFEFLDFNNQEVEYVLSITDILGREILNKKVHSNTRQHLFDTSNWEKGVYFFNIMSDKQIWSKKILKH